MRKVSSIILKVIAGFLLYGVSLLAFVSGPHAGMKLVILIVFSVPAVAALCAGLALTRFRDWRRDTGIVLLCASGFTAFLVLTVTCMYMTAEYREMMKPDTMAFFNDYLTGGGVIVGLAVSGWMLVKANKVRAEQGAALDRDSAALHPRQ